MYNTLLMHNTLLTDSRHIDKILPIINFIFFTFLYSSMLHVLLFIIEDELTDFNEEVFEDNSSDEEQVDQLYLCRCVIITGM